MMLRVIIVAVLIVVGGLSSDAEAAGKGKAAFLKSLVVPGWGQYENDRPTHALAFLSADLLFIGSALTLQHQGSQLKNDYEAFAATHAGVTGSHGKEFYIDVANWLNVYDFNEQRMADRNFGAIYDTDAEFWQWDSEANRARMDQMRVTSDRSYNRVTYALALVGVNHIVSAFHAGRLQSKSDSRVGWQVVPQRIRDGGKVNFSLWW